MIKSILVAVDGSDHSDKAVALAGEIAAKHDARMKLMYVRVPGPVPESLRHLGEVELHAAGGPDRDQRGDEEISRKVGELILDRSARQAKEAGAKEIVTVLEAGDPAECILKVAGDEGANLIVMGSRGMGGLGGLLMGSVSHKVAQLSPCSCITVK